MIHQIREKVAYVVPFGQLAAIVVSISFGLFKAKDVLLENYLDEPPPFSVVGEAMGSVINDYVLIGLDIIKNRCTLKHPDDYRAVLRYQLPDNQSRTSLVTVKPIIPVRPSRDIQKMVLTFNLTEEQQGMTTGSVSVDLQYQCSQSVEQLFVDASIKVL